MSYSIKCRDCGKTTIAGNIVCLLRFRENHTDSAGRIKCKECSSTNAHIPFKSRLQEKDKIWERYTQAIVKIETGVETYTPYVLLNSSTPDGEIRGIHFNYFNYFKDTRTQGGSLRHGHGPGGAPVLNKKELFNLLVSLSEHGVITAEDMDDTARRIRGRSKSAG